MVSIIKRSKYQVGDLWRDKNEEIWKIIRIEDSKLGSIFRIKHNEKYLTLSLDSMEHFLKRKLPNKILD